MRRFFIAIFRYLGVVGCLGLLSCLLIRSYFHISVPILKSDPEVEVLILGDSHPLHSISADMLGNRGMTLNPVRIISIPISIYA